jgi:uncharacterized protein (UPF0261 family)
MSAQPKGTIVVLATLDTKGVEAQFLREQIASLGYNSLVVDTGVIGEPAARADVTRAEVAQAGGISLADLLKNPTRETAAGVMAKGATEVVARLARENKVHGILAMGGTQGTTLSCTVMRALPYGFPKVMLSTMASGNVGPWVDIKDITMMFSVTDIMGLNRFSRTILANAAGAACGMASARANLHSSGTSHGDKPLIGITTVGITTLGAMHAAKVLEKAGYETITFHAVGSGGRAMEQLMREGIIGAVLDYATIEVSNQMHHALLGADDARLTTAGKLGLPQVICPGAIEVLVFNEPHTVPERYKGRTLIRHSPQITDVRLNKPEMIEVAEECVKRLSHTKGNAVYMVPTAAFDSYAVKGGGFHDPEADAAFTAVLKQKLPKCIRVVERDTHIDDPAFATEAAQTLMSLIESKASKR